MDELWIVRQLRVHYLDILSIPIDEQVSQVVEAPSNMGAKLPNCGALIGTDLACHFVSNK